MGTQGTQDQGKCEHPLCASHFPFLLRPQLDAEHAEHAEHVEHVEHVHNCGLSSIPQSVDCWMLHLSMGITH